MAGIHDCRARSRLGLPLPILAFLACLLVIPPVALAQTPDSNPVSSRVLQRLRDDSLNAPEVRVLFFQEDSGDACVGLGIKEGPSPMRPGFLVFQARQDGDKGKPQRLKFEFDKDQVENEGGLRTWTSCLPEEQAAVGPGSEIQVTVRRPRRDTQAFVIAFPPPGMANGVDLWQDHEGRLKSTDRSSTL